MPKLRWLLLVAPLLMAQDYGSGVAHVGAVSGAPPAAAGGRAIRDGQIAEQEQSTTGNGRET